MSLLKEANKNFLDGNYPEAYNLYYKLKEKYEFDFLNFNIKMCLVKIGDNQLLLNKIINTNKILNIYSVDIIIPIYNALEDVKHCINSLYEHKTHNFNVIAIDDCSNNETKEYLERESITKGFKLIRNEENLRFTKTVNRGFKESNGDFVVLLNSDTIVTPRWIEKILTCFNSDKDIGIVGPLSNAASWQTVPVRNDKVNGGWLVNEIPKGYTVDEMGLLIEVLSTKAYPKVPSVNGFCYVIKREVLNKNGSLDAEYFPTGYGEEDDFSIRTIDAGYKIAVADDTYIFHAKSKSYSHETKKVYSKAGRISLDKKHGSKRIEKLVNDWKSEPQLPNIGKKIESYMQIATKNKKVVYTAIFGNYDTIKEPNYINEDWDYICFTNNRNLKSKNFTVKYVDAIFENQTKNARMIKILSHIFLIGYDYSLWIDGSVQLRGRNIEELINKHKNQYISLHKHEKRNCVFDELEACVGAKKDNPDVMMKQIEKYKNEGMPAKKGQVETAEILRDLNSKKTKLLNLLWWKELDENSIRDQLSFNYVCWKNNFNYSIMEGYQWLDPYFTMAKHGSVYLEQKLPKVIIVVVVKQESSLVIQNLIQNIITITQYQNYEIILTNVSNSPEIDSKLTELKKIHAKVDVMGSCKGKSVVAAKNYIGKKIKATYICFLDESTNPVGSEWLLLLVNELINNKCAAAAGPAIIDSNYKLLSLSVDIIRKDKKFFEAQDSRALGGTRNVRAVSDKCLLIEKEAFINVNSFSTKLNNSNATIDLCFKLLENNLTTRFVLTSNVRYMLEPLSSKEQLNSSHKLRVTWDKSSVFRKDPNTVKCQQKYKENISTKQNKLSKSDEINKLGKTVLVITWDVGHNPLGRSYMLAEALEKSVRNVILMGFQFPRYGNDTWEPVRNGKFPVISLSGKMLPDLLNDFDKIVERFRPDVVIACKPRLPSVELGLYFKKKHGIPLIIDVDDHELSFFKNANNLSVKDFLKSDKEKLASEIEPYSETWTRVTNDLCKFADEIIVSNTALEREFGGVIVPHVRDEEYFDSKLYSKTKQRIKYNIPKDAKVVMFFGTPRHHKGVNKIAEAVGQIKDTKVILVVVGTASDKTVTNKLDEISKGKTIFLPNQPFSMIPEIICMADVVCLPQDVNNAISKYQLPAKAIDAIAMGVPLFVSNTEPLMDLVKDGVAKVLDTNNIASVLAEVFTKKQTSNEIDKIRAKFLEKYSYHAAALKMKTMIEGTLKKPRTSLDEFDKFVDFQKQLFGVKKVETIQKKGIDIVLFWKQNDTGMYGRRSDMVIKYLSSREDVRKVIVFDIPISENNLNKRRAQNDSSQDRNIYLTTYGKVLGKYENDKISFNVFIVKPGVPLYENKQVYLNFIQNTLDREKIDSRESIFWLYPKNLLGNDILNKFNPKKLVIDVVDDHRAWPNISDEEYRKLTQNYNDLLKRADVSFSNCEAVQESMKVFNKNIQLIPNGCEELPLIVEPKNMPLYEEMKNYNGKVIGYVGNLESKIDIALIEKIAKRFTDSLVVLAGSTHTNPAIKDLAKMSNIRLFGVVEYKYVGAVIKHFDVAIVPHLKTDLTATMNPLKVFVYIANKVRVVSTDIPNIVSSDLILISKTHNEFLEKINYILSSERWNAKFEKLYLEFISKNSWKFRFEKVLDNLFQN